jgi:hypothetical protein
MSNDEETPMHEPSDLLSQLVRDRQEARLTDAAASRLVPSSPARIMIARTLRRAADRLDAGAASPARVGSAIPGGGC